MDPYTLDDSEDELNNVDTSSMTPEEKRALKALKKEKKMGKEKLKRAMLNDQFEELSELLQMGTKMEKLSVLNLAIENIILLQQENSALLEQREFIQTDIERLRVSVPGVLHIKDDMADDSDSSGDEQERSAQKHEYSSQHKHGFSSKYETPSKQPSIYWQQPGEISDFAFGEESSEDDFLVDEEEQARQQQLQQSQFQPQGDAEQQWQQWQRWQPAPVQYSVPTKGAHKMMMPKVPPLHADDCVDMFLEDDNIDDFLAAPDAADDGFLTFR